MTVASEGSVRRKCLSVARALSEGRVCQPRGSVRRKCLSTAGQCQKEVSVNHRAMSGKCLSATGQCQGSVCQPQGNVREVFVSHRAMSGKCLSTTGQCQKEESVNHRAVSEGRVCQPQGNVRRKSLSTTTVVSGSSGQQCEVISLCKWRTVSTSAPCTFFFLLVLLLFFFSLLSTPFRHV